MATLTEMAAALVVHSSAVALSHLGVVLDVAAAPPPPPVAEQRVVARSPRKLAGPVVKASACPEASRLPVSRA